MKKKSENQFIHEKLSPDFERTIVYLENLMVAVCDFRNGPMKNPEPPHYHPHEQITYVAEGELIFFKGGIEHHLVKGDAIAIPSGTPHRIKTLSNHVRLIDSFHPVRTDFLLLDQL